MMKKTKKVKNLRLLLCLLTEKKYLCSIIATNQ